MMGWVRVEMVAAEVLGSAAVGQAEAGSAEMEMVAAEAMGSAAGEAMGLVAVGWAVEGLAMVA